MKRTIIILFLAFCSSLLIVNAQSYQTASTWFTVTEVTQKVWLIDDHKAANIYLIEGQDSALLVDTGIGAADLFSQVKRITDKPLIVVNTHGHPDHAGANFQFDKIYVNVKDSADSRAYSLPKTRTEAGKSMLNGAIPSAEDTYKGREINSKLVPVNDGYVFNLGGRHIQVIETPGHTPGSICLLDKENKLLFAGDSNNGQVWLFLPNCTPLSQYYQSLQMVAGRIHEFDTIFPGHGPAVESNFVLDQVECVKSILNHTCESKPYDSFLGKAQMCTYGRATVAFNPDNL